MPVTIRISARPGGPHALLCARECSMRRAPPASAALPRRLLLADRWHGHRRASRTNILSLRAPRRCPQQLQQSQAQFLAVRPASARFPIARPGPCEFRSRGCAAKLQTKAVRTVPRTPVPAPTSQRSRIAARPGAPETASGRFVPTPFSRQRAANSCSLAPQLRVSREEELVDRPPYAIQRTLPQRSAAYKSSRESPRSEEHTSELQSPCNLVCRLLLEKKKKKI